MGKLSLLLITTLVLIAITDKICFVAAEEMPPMYAAHDYASGELQKRRTIKPDMACDGDFGSDLEGIVTEMEKNKDANAEIANKLKKQFQDLMSNNKDKNLCEKMTWCDMGVCRKRGKIQGRSMDAAAASPAPPAPVTAAPVKAKPPPPIVHHDETSGTTTKTPDTTPSIGTREAVYLTTTLTRWVGLTFIAIVIPRNL